MGAKAWSKATEEQRAKHRASCIAEGKERKLRNFAAKNLDVLMILSRIKERYGIEPKELMKFILLLPKGHSLSDEQNRQWREMAIQKIPAAEIYQRIFEVTA